jgi:hypothetical protein
MTGDIASPVCGNDPDIFRAHRFGGEDVCGLPRFPKSDHRGVLQKQECIPDLFLQALPGKAVLEAKRLFVFNHPKPIPPAMVKVVLALKHDPPLTAS